MTEESSTSRCAAAGSDVVDAGRDRSCSVIIPLHLHQPLTPSFAELEPLLVDVVSLATSSLSAVYLQKLRRSIHV